MHTMWKGSISFGLVNIPIKMFAATEDKDIKFRYIHKECNTPIKYQKTCPTCNKELRDDEIVKGYEYEPGHFVVLKDEDFAAISSELKGKSIEIIDFVNLSEIDPIYFDKTYYLSPQDTGEKAYSLLREAMNKTGKIAIAKITIRNKQTLSALRISNEVVIMETIFYPDEIRTADMVPNLPKGKEIEAKELDIATKLIESLTSDFQPEKYQNDYRIALKELIEKKISGKEIKVAPEAPEKNVIDLMEALQASLDEAKKQPKTKKKTKTTKKKTTAS